MSSDNFFSPVFWLTRCVSPSVALQNLLPRVEKAKERSAASGHQDEEFTMELVMSLVQNALDCRGNRFSIFSQNITILIILQPSQRIKSGASSSSQKPIHYHCQIATYLSCRNPPISPPIWGLVNQGHLLVPGTTTTLRFITTSTSKC